MRPEITGKLLAEFGLEGREQGVVVGGAVARDAAPVGGFRSEVRGARGDFGVPALGFGELLAQEGQAAEAGAQPGVEVGAAEVAFVADALAAIAIEEQNRRGPDGLEALEPGRVNLDVSGDGQEMLLEEGRGGRVMITLGFQPSASASGGRGAEIEQQRPLLGLRTRQSIVHFGNPVHAHRIYPINDGCR